MSARCGLALVTFLVVSAADLAAQEPEPPPLRLPAGVHARVWTRAFPGQRIEGTLLGADAAAVRLVPKGSHPLAPGELRLPSSDVTRLELALEKKRHWWQGALIGAAVGLAFGLTDDVDPVVCEFNQNVLCSRTDAILTYGLGGAVSGAIVGALVRTDRWTPVYLGALGPVPTSRGAPWNAPGGAAAFRQPSPALRLSVRF